MTVVLTPPMVVLALAAVQASLWSHARTEARVVAQETAALVARTPMVAGEAESLARDLLSTQGQLEAVEVMVTDDGMIVAVVISARAPGIIRGTTVQLEVRGTAASESQT